MTAPNLEQPAVSDPTTTVLEILRQSSQPMTIAEIRAHWQGDPPSEKRLRELLEAQAFKFLVFATRSRGRSPRYWDRDEEQLAHERILELLTDEPRTRPELLKELIGSLGTGANRAWCEEQLDRLLREGQVKEHPPQQGQTNRLSLRPLNPLDYVPPSVLNGLTRVFEKLARVGVTAEQLTEALRPALRLPASTTTDPAGAEIDELILKGMTDVEARADDGTPVSIRELRRQMPETYRGEEFNRAIFRLAGAGRLDLHRATTPEPKSDEERRELARAEDGTFFAFASKRL